MTDFERARSRSEELEEERPRSRAARPTLEPTSGVAPTSGGGRQYTEEQAREILSRAAGLATGESTFNHRQLQEMAAELGIPEESLAVAEQSWYSERGIVEERQEFEKHRRAAFRSHVAVYIMVNIFLILLNAVVSFGTWWFIFPLLGWGLGLAIHGYTVTQKEGVGYEQEFQQWSKRRQVRSARRGGRV